MAFKHILAKKVVSTDIAGLCSGHPPKPKKEKRTQIAGVYRLCPSSKVCTP
jgi:hypothetical protein